MNLLHNRNQKISEKSSEQTQSFRDNERKDSVLEEDPEKLLANLERTRKPSVVADVRIKHE